VLLGSHPITLLLLLLLLLLMALAVVKAESTER